MAGILPGKFSGKSAVNIFLGICRKNG